MSVITGECWSEVFEQELEETRVKGVVLHQTLRTLNLRYCLAVKEMVSCYPLLEYRMIFIHVENVCSICGCAPHRSPLVITGN